jgi:16S rRNA (guanine966-N2)-methyltransferase
LLKITGGNLKGSKILIPKGDRFRPTLAKPREALFNIICNRYDIQAFQGVDLFAGSGMLGIEALSRGVPEVFFVDKDRNTISLVSSNIKNLSLEKQSTICCMDALQWIDTHPWQDSGYLFFIDPPYQTSLAQESLNRLSEKASELPGSLLVVETHKSLSLNVPSNLNHFQHKRYGITHLDFFEIPHLDQT